MNIGIVYLENMYRGKNTWRINGVGVKIWYNNFFGVNTKEFISIRSGSLMNKCFDFIGGHCDCWYNKSNNSFEMENDSSFAFSYGTYVVVWDKLSFSYKKLCRPNVKSSFYNRSVFSDADIVRFTKMRNKRGVRVK